ncbi:MAG: toprim domain-containing protein, partial [Holdemanella sp.]|nr:toprim domain-containing protein [Holdemanella sp.]
VQKMEKISYPEAVAKIAGFINYPLRYTSIDIPVVENVNKPYYDALDTFIRYTQYELKTEDGTLCRQYLQKRHLSNDIISRFGIGYAPNEKQVMDFLLAKDISPSDLVSTGLAREDEYGNLHSVFFQRFTIPIHDENGNPVGFTARILDNRKDVAKYINTSQTPIYEKGRIVFNYHRAKETARKEKRCFLVEGAMDVLAFEKAGIHESVACLGTACTDVQLSLLKKLQVPIYVCYDGDAAGRNATYKFGKMAMKARIPFQIIRNNTLLDPDELLEQKGMDEFHSIMNKTISFVDFLFDYLGSQYNLNNYDDKKRYAQEIHEAIMLICEEFERPTHFARIKELTGFDYSLHKDQEPTFSNRIEKPKIRYIEKPLSGRQKAEEAILSMMLVSKRAALSFKEQIGFFQNMACNQLSLYIYDAYRKMDILDQDILVAHIEEEDVRNLFVELISNPERMHEYNEEYFLDSMDKIKECTLQEQIDLMNKQIQEMESPMEKVKLAQKKSNLIIQKNALRRKEGG